MLCLYYKLEQVERINNMNSMYLSAFYQFAISKTKGCYYVDNQQDIRPYWTITILLFLLSSYLGGMKFFFKSTTQFYQTPHIYDYLAYIAIEFATFLSIGFEYQVSYKLCAKTPVPVFVVDVIFIVIMILMIVFTVVDLENSRELQNDIGYDYLTSYAGFPNRYLKKWTDREYVIQGGQYGSGTMKTIIGAFQLSLGHWIAMIFGILLIVAIVITILIIYRKKIALEFYPYHRKGGCKKDLKPDIEQVQQINEDQLKNNQNYTQSNYQILQQQIFRQTHKSINNSIIVLEIIGTIATIIMISLFCTQPYGKNLHAFVPAYYVMIKSFSKPYFDNQQINSSLQDFSNQVKQLNKYIISDQYPLVHGTLEQWCSWNQQQCQQQYPNINTNMNEQYITDKLDNPPNLVNIFYESWTPSPEYVKEEYFNAQTQDGWVDGQPYQEDVFKDLINISQNSINFLSLSTNSLPTIHAWQSLVTSEKVSLSSYNIVKSIYNQVESQNHILKQKYNFSSIYVSPAPGSFDGKNYWFKRQDLYDQIYYQSPTDEQIYDYNIPVNPKNAWVDDIITTRQAMLAFGVNMITSGQAELNYIAETYCRYCEFPEGTDCSEIVQRHIDILKENQENFEAKQGQPLLLSMLTVNTHNPWKGYFKKSDNMYNYSISNDYERQLQYSQTQISNLINFILEVAPNTIFTINGDHGSRISAQDRLKEKFDNRCKNKVFGNDEMYDVSGILGWGQEVSTEVTNSLQQYINKTYTKMFDFDDLINLIYQIYDIQIPTSRNSYFNKQEIINGTWLQKCSQKLSTSATHTIIEVRKNDSIFRGNLFSPDNGLYIENLQYPTCTVSNNLSSNIIDDKDKSKQLYEEGLGQIQLYDYYIDKNRLWNDQFYDEECWFDPINNQGKFCQLQ